MTATWESLWIPLLTEAAKTAAACPNGSSALSPAAAAIILARASWEGFVNEFVQWRGLEPAIKEQHFRDAIFSVHRELGADLPQFNPQTLWGQLSVLNSLRNHIVHYKAIPHEGGDAPSALLSQMMRIGVIASVSPTQTWERQVLTRSTATWACSTVGAGMLELEKIPHRSRRSFTSVERAIADAMSSI